MRIKLENNNDVIEIYRSSRPHKSWDRAKNMSDSCHQTILFELTQQIYRKKPREKPTSTRAYIAVCQVLRVMLRNKSRKMMIVIKMYGVGNEYISMPSRLDG